MRISAEDIDNLNKRGIYSITNCINNKKYIGSTAKNFKQRLRQHCSKLKNGKHHCHHLQNAYIKYGEDNFLFKIEQIVVDIEHLRDIEKNYIRKYNAVEEGYNENPDPNCSPMLNGTQQKKVSISMKQWWKNLKQTLSPSEYKEFCKKHGSIPWNKGIKMTEAQKINMRAPKKNGVSEKMKEVFIHNSKLGRARGDYYLVYDSNHNWINTFWCVSDLIDYGKSEFNNLPVKRRKGEDNHLDFSKVTTAATKGIKYKGMYFKRVPKTWKLSYANGMNSWKAEKPIMSQAIGTPIEGAETTGEV